MEKLIDLLNEYEIERKSGLQCIGIDVIAVCLTEGRSYRFSYLISKEFGFIQWLVENDKIDIHNIPPISITKGGEETAYNEPVMLYDRLLMLLSISDSPIDDLISYLK